MSTTTLTGQVAGLAGDDEQLINGVAVGVGDITRGLSGDQKVWTAEELRAAASSLEGTPVNPLHSEQTVGEVVRAGFDADRGVIYEAALDDASLAEQAAGGHLEVSIEARHADGGTVETDRGEAMLATNIQFTGLSLVQRGAAPSASATAGEAAALSATAIHAALEEDAPASTDGDASDIEISDEVEEGLENKVGEHNEGAPESKQVTLGMLKKVFRRGAGAWLNSNAGATQQQWAYARVNAFLEDLMADRPLNDGNDNDLAPDGYDVAENAGLVDVNGTEVDIEPPERVINAVEAGFEAKEEYDDAIGDCGTGVGEAMAEAIVGGELTPEILVNGGDIASNSPATYLASHESDVDAEGAPTTWSEEDWTGGCGEVQQALWGFHLEWFEETKAEIEDAMEDAAAAVGDDEWSAETRFFRVVVPEEDAEQFDDDVLGVGVDFPESGVYVDWHTSAFPDELENPHVSEYGSVSDLRKATGNDIVDLSRPPGEAAKAAYSAAMEDSEMAYSMDEDANMAEVPDEYIFSNPGEAVEKAEEMGVGDDEDLAGDEMVHTHGEGGDTVFMPGPTHDDLMEMLEEMDELAEADLKGVGPVEFDDTGEGELDESEIPSEGFEPHYLNAGDTKSDSSFPLVDADGTLRRGNVDAAWNLRGQGDLGMPRDAAERVMRSLGREFGEPGTDANPIPEDAYEDAEMAASDTDDAMSPSAGQAEASGERTDTQTTTDNAHMSDTEEELRARLSEKEDRIAELETEVEQLEDERADVARAYAEALAAGDSVFDEDELVDKFTVAELAAKFDAVEDASLADVEPDVQSGDSDEPQTATLSDSEQAEVAELRSAMADLAGSETRLAEIQREQHAERVAELTDEDVESVLAEV